jgi:drug/metabolite transporter (DMT)-like permease
VEAAGQHDAQLQWERRAGRWAAAAGFASAVCLVANTILVQAVVLQDRPTQDRGVLLAIDEYSGAFLLASVVQGLNYIGLGVVLWFLFKVTRYRRQELPAWFIWLIYIGPLLFAVASVLSTLDRIDIAEQFASSGETQGRAGERRAEDLLEDRSPASVALGAAGTLAVAFSLVLVSLNAMRAGVLSRFLGIIGIIVGVLYVIPIFGGPLIVQIFWLGALGAVFLGYWPGGRGEAWETGTAVHWPSAAERRREALGAAAAAEAEQEPEAEPPEEPGPSRRRRKRRR